MGNLALKRPKSDKSDASDASTLIKLNGFFYLKIGKYVYILINRKMRHNRHFSENWGKKRVSGMNKSNPQPKAFLSRVRRPHQCKTQFPGVLGALTSALNKVKGLRDGSWLMDAREQNRGKVMHRFFRACKNYIQHLIERFHDFARRISSLNSQRFCFSVEPVDNAVNIMIIMYVVKITLCNSLQTKQIN
jgi:hypothetical protein